MIDIRPVSDLRNKYTDIEEAVVGNNRPVYLTKNGRGVMVVMSIEQYAALTDDIEDKLDEADREAECSEVRLTGDEVFARARGLVRAR